jgi:hypothetical protein
VQLSAHEAARTRNCAFPSCTNEANGGDVLCFDCRRAGRAVTPAQVVRVQAPTPVDAELTCRDDGCHEPADPNATKGTVHSGRCRQHGNEASARSTAKRLETYSRNNHDSPDVNVRQARRELREPLTAPEEAPVVKAARRYAKAVLAAVEADEEVAAARAELARVTKDDAG